MVTSAALSPLTISGARLQVGTSGECKDLLRGSLRAGLNMHLSPNALIPLFHGNASHSQCMADKSTPESTLERALSHAKRVDGICRQLEAGLSFLVAWLYLPKSSSVNKQTWIRKITMLLGCC